MKYWLTESEVVNCTDVVELQAECLRLRQELWNCFTATGGDTDGDASPFALMTDVGALAVDAVKELSKDYADCYNNK